MVFGLLLVVLLGSRLGATSADGPPASVRREFIQTHKTLQLLGVNITTWGPQAERFLKLKAFDGQLLFMVEHKQPKENIVAMQSKMRKLNWTSSVSPATPGLGLGFSSGTLVAWRSGQRGEPLHLGILPEQQGRACYAKVFLKGGIELIAVSVHMWVGV